MSEHVRRGVGGPRAALAGFALTMLCALTLVGGLFASSAQAATSAFVERAASPAPLTSVTIDPATQIIYAQENEGQKFFSYDPRTNEWTELPEAPLNSGNNGGATYLNGKIYTSYTQTSEELGVYDIATESWSTIKNPLGEGTGNITTVGEELYMVDQQHFIKYNPTSEATTELAKPPFYFDSWGGLQPYNGKIYGDAGDGGTRFGSYDLATNTWTSLPSLPEGAVLGSALDPVTGSYFAYGSYGGKNLYTYDIATKEWTTSTVPLGALDDGGMVYVSLPGLDGIYMTEGEDSTGFTRYMVPAELSLSMSAIIVPSVTGGEVSYTLKVANGGPSEAANVKVSDSLPSGMSVISATSTQGSCSGTSTVTCAIGSLAVEGMVTVAIKVAAPAGTATNTATVSSETADADEANNSASASTVIAALLTSPPAVHCVVPRVHGMAFSALSEALSAAHCTVGAVHHVYNRKVAKGDVVYSNPHHGGVLQESSEVNVWVSRGRRPALCVVPRKLHGMSLKHVKKALRAAHCKPGKIMRVNNRKVRKGHVIVVKPAHGRHRPAGSKVAIWVSKGRHHRRHHHKH